ncbi:MAG TPA: hypothetical protein VGJ58_05740 [Gaiellaceae bacterium]|jgi:hypothetical protein
MTCSAHVSFGVAADMCGCDSLRLLGDQWKKGAYGGNMVFPVRNIPPDEVIPLETLRLGLRGDTLKEVLLSAGEPLVPPRAPSS